MLTSNETWCLHSIEWAAPICVWPSLETSWTGKWVAKEKKKQQ